MLTPADTVNEFLTAWSESDVKKLAGYFAPDAVYHNIPMEPITGRGDIEAAFAGFFGMAGQIRVDTLHLVAEGSIVMTERVDHFVTDSRTVTLPVMGIFEVHGGAITAWRDYFDLNQFTTQMSAAG